MRIILCILIWIYTIFHYIHGAFFYQGYGDFFLILNDARLWYSQGIWKDYFGAYTPFYFLLMRPFVYLKDTSVVFIMHIINQFLLLGTLVLLFSAIQVKRYRWLILSVILPAVLNFRALLYTISMIKIEMFELFLIAGAYILFKKNRDIASGACIAIGGMTKILPYFLFFYFLWKRQWRVVWSVVGISVVILSLAMGIFGAKKTTSYFLNLTTRIADKENETISWYENQSVTGAVFRLFSNLKESTAPSHPKVVNKNLANFISTGLKIFLLCLLGFFTKKSLRKRDSTQFDCEFSLTLIAMLLLNPFSRDYYSVFLLPVYILMAKCIVQFWKKINIVMPVLLIVVSYFIIGQGFPLGLIRFLPKISPYGDNLFAYLHYSIPTYGYFVLLCGVLMLSIKVDKIYG